MKKIIFAALVALSLAACQTNYEKTPLGSAYKIFPGPGGEKAAVGQFVKYNYEVMITGRGSKKDTLLTSTYGKMPFYSAVDTGARSAYSYMEIMQQLSSGDSAILIVSVDTLKSKNIIDPNDSIVFVKGSSVQFKLKLLNIFKTQDSAMADVQKEMDLDNEKAVKSVEDYMAKNSFKGVKTKSGAYVMIDKPGDLTMMADSGTIAYVRYKGYLQENGDVFDTNTDSSKGHYMAGGYPVTVATHTVIQGWDEALPYFGKGGSGKVFVPAFLGYGPRGNPPAIPGNAGLVFDIEILDVKPAPPAPKNNPVQMPPAQR